MDFSAWQYYQNAAGVNIGLIITHESGEQESRLLIDPEVATWLDAGGQPLPA